MSLATHGNAGIAAWNFKLKGSIHSYEDAEAFLCQDRLPDLARARRDLGPQMVVAREPGKHGLGNGYIAVQLYQTDIIRYYPDGTVSVDNGGHNTPTTTARLAAVLPLALNPYPESNNGVVYHHRKQLGVAGLWPLDHSKRIDPETKTIKED